MSTYRALAWDKPITVYHRVLSVDALGKTVTNWHRMSLENCFYGLKARQVINGLQIVSSNVHIVRIPASVVSDGFALGKGDIVVNGAVTDELPSNDSGSALRAKYAGNCFIVGTYRDNRDLPNTAHLYASED